MDCAITKRLPCSVCGLVALRHHNWFLAMENRWLDRLKVFTWHRSLAREQDVKSACCRLHLKVLVAYWLKQASLRLATPANHLPIPIGGYADDDELDLSADSGGRVIGELSVCREPMSQGWVGSPETLESILDALIPAEIEIKRSSAEFRIFEPPLEPSRSRFSQPRFLSGLPPGLSVS